jgi:pimeloyl-ACP methyl ester carboxylesterase
VNALALAVLLEIFIPFISIKLHCYPRFTTLSMRATTTTTTTTAPHRARIHSSRGRTRRCRATAARGTTNKTPIVILPGLGNESGDYDELVSLLRDRGHVVGVADVKRYDWLRNAAGAVKREYWAGNLKPRPTVDWYLERVATAVRGVVGSGEGEKVTLVAHSAGGWLARVYIDDFDGDRDVGALVTLGSPMKPTPKGVAGVVDQTRGILDFVEANCRKTSELAPIKVTCVAGTYKRGSDSVSDGVQEFICGLGYKQVCGDANVDGDGITPIDAALMEGARHIVLDGVYHTPLGADSEKRKWYGSPEILDAWASVALE